LRANPSEAAKQRTRASVIHKLLLWVIWLLVAAIILLNLFTHVLLLVHYSGDSMEPGLKNGRTLLISKTSDVSEGDIIAFYFNNQILVRRVICTGGNRIDIQNDGTVLINDVVLEEPYVEAPSMGQCNISFPFYVQTGYVFAMGDNRELAMDSRLEEIGVISERRIIGKVIFVF
jgi:signal peptidase I